MVGRGWTDGWQQGTCLRLRGSCKAQREVLGASGKLDVHATIKELGPRAAAARGRPCGHSVSGRGADMVGRGWGLMAGSRVRV